MKVSFDETIKIKTVKFKDIKVGEVFKNKGGSYYLKCEDNLENGQKSNSVVIYDKGVNRNSFCVGYFEDNVDGFVIVESELKIGI